MLVKYWMRTAVVTIRAEDSLREAISRMKEYFVPLLPVLKGQQLVGVVTDRDLKRASASDASSLDMYELAYLISRVKVGDIMSKNPITVPPDYTLEETAALLLKHNISGAPVVDEGRIVGTISQREIFRALVTLTGLEKRGLHLAFEVPDMPGTIKAITDVIRAYNGRLVSILTSSERARPGCRHVYIRTYGIDRNQIPAMKEELKEKGTLLYMVDHRENLREEFKEVSRAVVPRQPGIESRVKTRKILVCTDFSANSLPAQLRAVEYAKTFGAELMIAHVVSPHVLPYPALEAIIFPDTAKLEQQVRWKAEAQLESLAEQCRQEVKIVTTRLLSGVPAEEIVRCAEREEVDVIVMGTHGWSGLRHLIVGSVAETVVRMAKMPVLTVRAPGES